MQKDLWIDDFTNQRFQSAYKKYAEELGNVPSDWERTFRAMNEDKHGKNFAILRISPKGDTVGFIQFTALATESWFFRGNLGFIREFWVEKGFRNRGEGTRLLTLAEEYFKRKNYPAVLLTTDSAEGFYLKNGYKKTPGIRAENGDDVFLKLL